MPIIEFITRGNSVKVSAIDEMSGTEVSIVADAKTPRNEMEKVALRKLDYILKKKFAEEYPDDDLIV